MICVGCFWFFKVLEAKQFCSPELGGPAAPTIEGAVAGGTTGGPSPCRAKWSEESDCTKLDQLKTADDEALCACMDLIPEAQAEALVCTFSGAYSYTVQKRANRLFLLLVCFLLFVGNSIQPVRFCARGVRLLCVCTWLHACVCACAGAGACA